MFGFFKIFSQRHVIGEENQYLQLFGFIDMNDCVDNNILLKQNFVKHDTFIIQKQIQIS